MKNFLLLLSFVLFFLPNQSYTQWVSANGPAAGEVRCMVLSGSNIFAAMGNYNGVFLSTDNGVTWTPVNNGLGIVRGSVNRDIWSLAVIGSNLFAATANKGVYMSSDNGTTWTAANAGMTTATVQALAVIGTNLFAATSSLGTLISTDNGTTWNTINTGLPGANVKYLMAYGSNLYAGMSGAGIRYSTNNGTSWSNINGYLTATRTPTGLATDGVHLFAATNAGCFRSNINDTGWTNISTGLVNANSYTIAMNGSDLFAGTFSGISHSTNNGTNWTTNNTGIWTTVQQVDCFLFNGGTIFAGSDQQGIFASTNNGANWSLSSNGLTNDDIYSLYSSDSNLYAGTQYNSIWLSTNNGGSWSSISTTTLTNNAIMGITSVGGYLFVATGGNGTVYRSSNNGTTWSLANTGLAAAANRCITTDGVNLYVGLYNAGVWKSTDNGGTWAVDTGTVGQLGKKDVRGLFFDGTNVWAGNNSTGVFVSTDQGATWTARNTGLTLGQQYYAFGKLGPWIYTASPGSSAWRSSNNGVTWSQMPSLPPGVNAFVTYGSTLYAGASVFSGSTFFQSSDSGATWTANAGGLVLTALNVTTLALCNSNLFLGTQDNGTWKMTLPPLTSALTLTTLIQGFTNAGTGLMISDTVTAELHNSGSPYALIESKKGVLNTSGVGTFTFTTAVNGTPYYLVVKHRNAIETWSGAGNSFTAGSLSYDFTSAQSQAYEKNQILIGSKWCLYNGDVNQDGLVDSGDLGIVDNDNANYTSGYTNTDVNGDGIVDSGDLGLVDNNNANYVGKIIPSGVHTALRTGRKINQQIK